MQRESAEDQTPLKTSHYRGRQWSHETTDLAGVLDCESPGTEESMVSLKISDCVFFCVCWERGSSCLKISHGENSVKPLAKGEK